MVEVFDKPEPKPAPRASVTFKTGSFPFVWVKVAGKVLALEPVGKVQLKAGQHTVYFRTADSEPWAKAGSIRRAISRRSP